MPFVRHDRAAELRLDPVPVRIENGRIAAFEDGDAELRVDASGCAVVPGFVDCHTHLPFAGWRASEYELKVSGASYEEIARAGGGIAASAAALAEAGDPEILDQAKSLADEMLAWGTTAFECTSGYGLSAEGELRPCAWQQSLTPWSARRRLDGAACPRCPPGYSADGWMDEVESLLPRVTEDTNASALDIYVESIAFSNQHLARLGELAAEAGLALR